MRGARTAVLVALISLAMLAGCGPARPAAHATAPSATPPAPAPAPSVTSPVPSAAAAPTSPSGSSLPASPSGSSPPVPRPSASPRPDLLRPGASGPEVLAVQQRLAGLGYWLGTPDGRYGSATVHALTAFQKLAGLDREA